VSKPLASLAILIILLSALATPYAVAQTSAQSAIQTAQNTIQTCTQAIAAAETAGANVDTLMITLKQATNQLNQAELAYAAGNNQDAYRYASQSQTTLNGLANQATLMQNTATQTKTEQQTTNNLLLLIAAAIFATGALSWFILNRQERRQYNEAPTI
jgi:uncharacterized membrane protein YidH (DUF202 family)